MQIGTKVSFHNRFDIEVYDSSTGRLKQKGSAENIVLDRMYTRLCKFSSYFTQIVFGSGTDDLSPSRTTLFNREGSKSATTEEIIKGFPVSKWTRSITLAPEEFVGVELTEVGISEHDTNINTHALIKDAEGNQLSIMKTATDIVIIYATVFIELQDNGENIYWCNLPNNNGMLNYLLGESAPGRRIILGRKWTKGDTISDNIIQSKTGSYTPDTGNKKVKLNTLRFGIDEGNEPIAEIEIFDSFKTTLPNTAVFQDYILKDINIGVGDGNTREFALPHIRAENIVVKVDNVVNNDIAMQNYNNVNFKVQNLTGVGSNGRGVTISSDGNIILTASGISPYFTVHRLNADTGEYEKVQNLTGVGSNGRGVTISSDGNTIVTASYDSSPYFTVHRLNADTGEYEKVQDLTGVGKDGRGVTFSPGGNMIVAASYKSPCFTVHNFEKTFKTIIFTTPPPEGAVITADYLVPYIPKSEDYVLDVSAEVQFGEGAIV